MMTKYGVSSPEEKVDDKKVVSEKPLKECCKKVAKKKKEDCECECKECGNQIVVQPEDPA